MRKLLLILSLVLLPSVFALSIFDAFTIIDPFASGTFSISVDAGNTPIWNQSISNVTVNQDASVSTVDANMTLLGNGQCTDADGTTPTFSVASENTSAVDCSVSGVQLNITPASSFYGNSICIISCADATNSTNSTFTITVNQVIAAAAEEESTTSESTGGGGGGGVSFGSSISETGPELELSTDRIEIELNRGQKATKTVIISNNRNVSRTLETEVSGVASLVLVKNRIHIQQNRKVKVDIDFEVPSYYDLGVYSGSIDFEFDSVMVVVEVKDSKKDIDIDIELHHNESESPDLYVGQIEFKSFYPGQTLNPTLDLSLFYEKGINYLDVEYRIIDNANQVVYSEIVENVETFERFTKDVKLSRDIIPGRYVLAVLTNKEGFSGSDYVTFEVLEQKPLLDETAVITISVVLANLALIFIVINNKRAKRYGKKSR